MTDHIIQLQGINKSFDDHITLDNVSLDINNGEFLTLLGPSGCGKTTLMRIIAGFEQPDSGDVLLNGQVITDLPPERRSVNMVFQNYALFPHMTVYDNVAFGLTCQGLSKDVIEPRVMEALQLVHMERFAQRKPNHLSGGQQQRIALARAVINRPLVLLLDEPFSALDYSLRKNMRIELKTLQRELGITFIFVTHDQEEALSMSDRIAILNNGKIEQIDSARVVYEEPENLFTAQFIGEANIFKTTVASIDNGQIAVTLENRQFRLTNKKSHAVGDTIFVVIRPEDFDIWGESEIQDKEHCLPGVVEQIIYKGSTVDLIVKLDSGLRLAATEFFNEDDPNLHYNIGEKVFAEWTLGWEITLAHE